MELKDLATTHISDHMNPLDTCFICGKNHDEPCMLIPVFGRRFGSPQENTSEAAQVHIRCMLNSNNWHIDRKREFIYFSKIVRF